MRRTNGQPAIGNIARGNAAAAATTIIPERPGGRRDIANCAGTHQRTRPDGGFACFVNPRDNGGENARCQRTPYYLARQGGWSGSRRQKPHHQKQGLRVDVVPMVTAFCSNSKTTGGRQRARHAQRPGTARSTLVHTYGHGTYSTFSSGSSTSVISFPGPTLVPA